MSEIQEICIIIIVMADVVFNMFGWSYLYPFDFNSDKPLLVTLIISDVISAIVVVLGAIGVFG